MQWLWGGYAVSGVTLTRFYSLHYLLPFLIVGVVALHLVALHQHGSNNPLGIDAKGPQDKIPFHPYYTIKDMVGLGVFLLAFSVLMFYYPNWLTEPDNYIPANPLVTPAHIVPEWYLLPYYAILRSIPDKLGGVIAMFAAIVVLLMFISGAISRHWTDATRLQMEQLATVMRFSLEQSGHLPGGDAEAGLLRQLAKQS